MKFFRLTVLVVLCGLLGQTNLSSALASDWGAITNKVPLNVSISLPSGPALRGNTQVNVVAGAYERGSCTDSWGGGVAYKISGAPSNWEGRGYDADVSISVNGNGSPYGINPAGSPAIFGGVQTSIYTYGGGGSGNFTSSLSFNTSGWPKGEYTALVFYNNGCNGNSTGSVKFSLPELISPNVSCELVNSPKLIHSGDEITISCTSNVELVNMPLTIEQNTGASWNKLVDYIANGKTFQVPNIPTSTQGSISLQVKSQGIRDQVNPFTSNVFAIKVLPPLRALDFSVQLTKFSASGNSQLKVFVENSSIVGQPFQVLTSVAPAGPWEDFTTLRIAAEGSSFNINKPKGTWVKIGFAGNDEFKPGFSNVIQLVEVPTLKCSLPANGKEGVKLTGSCVTNISLAKTPITFQINGEKGWEDKGDGILSGLKTPIYLTPGSGGTVKLRITSQGLTDMYGPFISNVMTVKVVGKPVSTSSSAPKGKVDKTSNAYSFMYKVGGTFARVSMASDSANSQCSSAQRTGMIKANGVPQHLGVQARLIQSYLQTASGFQGCLDGFKRS